MLSLSLIRTVAYGCIKQSTFNQSQSMLKTVLVHRPCITARSTFNQLSNNFSLNRSCNIQNAFLKQCSKNEQRIELNVATRYQNVRHKSTLDPLPKPKTSSPSPKQKSNSQEWEELSKLSMGKRLKILAKKYWYIAVPLHGALCLVWFGAFYFLAKCGLNGAAIINFISPYITEWPYTPDFIRKLFEKDADKLGHAAVALLLYKLATPARYASTVFASIYTVKFLMNRGVLIKSASELSHSYANHAIAKNLTRRVIRIRKNISKSVLSKKNKWK